MYLTDTQNLRMGRVGRSHSGSIWSGLPAQVGPSQSTWHRVVSRWFWNISGEEDTTASLGSLYPHRSSSSVQAELAEHQFLPAASCSIAQNH